MKVTNVAVPGAAWYEEGKKTIPDQTSSKKSTSYDYIIFHPSSNDVNKYGNSLTKSYNALINYLDKMTKNSKWASSRIGAIITPHPDYGRSGLEQNAFESWIAKFRSACSQYSIPVLDLHSDNSMEIKGENGSYDGKHPSRKLQRNIGGRLAQWMTTLPKYKYKVTFDLNGLSADSIEDQKVVHGKKAKAQIGRAHV